MSGIRCASVQVDLIPEMILVINFQHDILYKDT